MRTDIFIIGAQKAATTTLFELMCASPRISGASNKEPHFFSTADDWKSELPGYEALFEQRPDAIYLEASTSYTFYPQRRLGIWDDIHEYNPEARFIYIVRDPLDRIVAAWRHGAARGYGQPAFEDFVFKNPLAIRATRYHTQITPFIRRFGRGHVLLIDFAEFVADQTGTLAQVSEFIGLPRDHFGEVAPLSANTAARGKAPHWLDPPPGPLARLPDRFPRAWYALTRPFHRYPAEKPEVAPAARRAIGDLLEPEIAALEELMQRDFTAWRQQLR
ncbi:MAG: sulfotransferase family protein [Phycisphaeraceae bacterium]